MEKYFIAALSAANQIGIKRLQLLIKFFGSAKAIWNATDSELSQTGLSVKALNSLVNFRHEHPDAPKNLVKFCESKNFKLCSIVDEDYPPILKEITNPPPIFYYIGNLKTVTNRIAIVGTREATFYGERIARKLGEDLAKAGITIVSGAARGIDTFAHEGAMKFGRTVAVLGCGLNYVFRSLNNRLLKEIAENGVVMSEFEPNLKPSAGTFPSRNRIIAGLCRGVIVVEAGKKSGALITSDCAGDYGRDVFAVPGDVRSPKSLGCHELIRDGATLIKSAQDVLDYYKFSKDYGAELFTDVPVKVESVKLEGNEKKIFDLIPSSDYITLEEISMQIDDIAPSEISSIALSLEMKKYIVEDDGRYIRNNL